MLEKPLPRFVIVKPLARRRVGFYFTVPTYYRKRGCTIPNEPLGSGYEAACGEDGVGGRAAALNGLFDEWRASLAGEPIESIARYGTVDWLFREYKSSNAYLEKVSKRSRPDYERTMLMVADTLTKNGDRIGSRLIQSITPRGADKIYEKIIIGAKGKRSDSEYLWETKRTAREEVVPTYWSHGRAARRSMRTGRDSSSQREIFTLAPIKDKLIRKCALLNKLHRAHRSGPSKFGSPSGRM
jgi:hypothetical protein